MHPGLQWTLRVVLFAGCIWLLRDADRAAHIASIVTIVVPIGGFYIAALEPKILNLIVQRLRWAYETRIWEPKRRGLNATVTERPEAKPARQMKAARLTKGKPLPKPKPRFNWRRLQPDGPAFAAVLGITCMLTFAVFFGRSQGRLVVPYETPPEAPPVRPPIESGPPDEPVIDDPPADTAASQPFIIVRAGDTCYEIAAACTGDAERFVELGPPLNEGLDVSNRSLCLIRPGDRLKLPADWPTECAD